MKTSKNYVTAQLRSNERISLIQLQIHALILHSVDRRAFRQISKTYLYRGAALHLRPVGSPMRAACVSCCGLSRDRRSRRLRRTRRTRLRARSRRRALDAEGWNKVFQSAEPAFDIFPFRFEAVPKRIDDILPNLKELYPSQIFDKLVQLTERLRPEVS